MHEVKRDFLYCQNRLFQEIVNHPGPILLKVDTGSGKAIPTRSQPFNQPLIRTSFEHGMCPSILHGMGEDFPKPGHDCCFEQGIYICTILVGLPEYQCVCLFIQRTPLAR